MFQKRVWAILLAAVLAVGLGLTRTQPLQAGQSSQAGQMPSYPTNCTDNGIFIRCLLQQTGPNQDLDELWECTSGHLQLGQDANGQQQVTFDGTCAVEVHHGADPAWVWAGGYADHVQVCPAGQLWRTDSGEEWEVGPDCVLAPTPSLDVLASPNTWSTDPVAWSDAVLAPAACGWTQSC
jgi:hypothetical protein